MMKTLLALVLLTIPLLAKESPCPQIDRSVLDVDGMPFCPAAVKENSAFAVTRCAIRQAKSWHEPTKKEEQLLQGMLEAFKENAVGGIKKENTDLLLAKADGLGLQACRVKSAREYKGGQEQDSYLLLYTKPGKKDYNGPFLMLREVNASNVMVLSPHDGSDGTHTDTKLALQRTHARVVVSNGHPKGIHPDADFVDHNNTLGNKAARILSNMFPKPVVLHIHGMKGSSHVMYRSRSKSLSNAFEKGVKLATNIDRFTPFNADYAVDTIKTPFYLKTEIPARIHTGNHGALAKIVETIEQNDWAWSGVDPDPDTTEPTPEEPKPEEPKPEVPKPEVPTVPEQPETPPPVEPTPIKYAPRQKIKRGEMQLVCVSLKWQNQNHHVNQDTCKRVARHTADFYERNSRGLMKFKPSGYLMEVPLNAAVKNVSPAEELARAKYKSDGLHIIINNNVKKYSHASNKIAHLRGSLLRTSDHEVGHLLGLGHAGAYKDGDNLDHYADGSSAMGAYPSNLLTAPQYYHLGWLLEEEAAIYEPGKVYELKRVNDYKNKGLITVIVNPREMGQEPGPKSRRAFISFPADCKNDKAESCLVLHLSNGGSSQRIKLFGRDYHDERFTGLHIKTLEAKDGKVKISIDFQARIAVKK